MYYKKSTRNKCKDQTYIIKDKLVVLGDLTDDTNCINK
jgi:hypothetical protein